MKIASLLLAAASACALSSSALADIKDDLAAALKAQNDAPAYRAKVVTTDTGMGMNMTVTMERVKPNLIHVKTEGGPVSAEVFSDGTKTMMRQTGGPLQEAPPQVAQMLTQNSQEEMMKKGIEAAKNVKVVGHEAVNGAPATIYTYDAEMNGLQAANKLWVADKEKRPVKSEIEMHGKVSVGGQEGPNVNMKIATSIEYDSSIKVAIPEK